MEREREEMVRSLGLLEVEVLREVEGVRGEVGFISEVVGAGSSDSVHWRWRMMDFVAH